MGKCKTAPRFIRLGLVIATLSSGQAALASGFQLWEENAAGTGDYHSGYAADANDASTLFYNPAGLTEITHPQVVGSIVGINVDEEFHGTVKRVTSPTPGINTTVETGTAEGGGLTPVPSFYYAQPIIPHKFTVGIGVAVPFGLATDYSKASIARYAATESSISAIDFMPGFGIAINDKLSVGAALDVDYVQGEFDLVAGAGSNGSKDSVNTNTADDTALGWHAGILYKFTPMTRAGLAYHSKIHVNLSGDSKFEGPLVLADDNVYKTNDLSSSFDLPAYTSASLYHDFNPRFGVTGTVDYTQWSSFDELTLNNVAGIAAPDPKSKKPKLSPQAIDVNVVENFRNTWNFAVGAHYKVNNQLLLRCGGGWDETPVRGDTRNLQLPDANKWAVSAGAHYQPIAPLGVDVGYTHFFVNDAHIHDTQATGSQTTTSTGEVQTNIDLFALQLTWTFV